MGKRIRPRLIEEHEDSSQPTQPELRRFGLLLGCGLSLFSGVALPVLLRRTGPLWPWIVGGALVLCALVAPDSLRWVYTAATRMLRLANRVLTAIAAALAFVVVIIPAALTMRLLGHDPMARRFDPEAPSYRIESRSRQRHHMERPF